MSDEGPLGGGGACCSQLWKGDLPLNLGAGTFDVMSVAGGDILIEKVSLYSTVTALLITSVSMQTNSGTPYVILSALDGALANLLIGRQIMTTWNQSQPLLLRSGQKITYSVVGLLGSGNIRATIQYRLVDPLAVVSP